MKRRSVLSVMGLLVSLGSVKGTDLHTQDIEFLLKEFGMKAEVLLRLKKIDWQKVMEEARAATAKAQTDEEHLKVVARLIGRLQDGHAGIVKSKVKWPDVARGQRYTGPRVALLALPDRVLIRWAFKDAAAAGLRAGQVVTRIDGVAAPDWLAKKAESMRGEGQGFSTPQMALYSASHWGLADFEGTKITFEIQDADGEGPDDRKGAQWGA